MTLVLVLTEKTCTVIQGCPRNMTLWCNASQIKKAVKTNKTGALLTAVSRCIVSHLVWYNFIKSKFDMSKG